MNRKLKKILGLTAITFIVLMILFPPWKLKGYEPSMFGDGYRKDKYGFLFNPPNYAIGVAWERLTLQFLLVGALSAGVIGINRINK
jgi:hypothetical protein